MKVGAGAYVARKFFVVVASLHFFGSTCTISRFGERFRDGQIISDSVLFVPRCPSVPAVNVYRGHMRPVPCGSGATG